MRKSGTGAAPSNRCPHLKRRRQRRAATLAAALGLGLSLLLLSLRGLAEQLQHAGVARLVDQWHS